jgi:hypothetical protein
MKRLVLILVLVAAIAVVKLLPWWGSLALLVGLGLGVKLFAWKLVERLMLGAFRAKGAALAGADATLHGITSAEPPSRTRIPMAIRSSRSADRCAGCTST